MPKTKQPKSKLNVKLLRKIQKHILEEPRRFFMAWFTALGKPGTKFASKWSDLAATVPPCGTAHCIAGWANHFTDHEDASDVVHAAKVLRLSESGVYWWNLFEAGDWPEPFRWHYENAKTPKARAKIAAARIDHLIEHGE